MDRSRQRRSLPASASAWRGQAWLLCLGAVACVYFMSIMRMHSWVHEQKTATANEVGGALSGPKVITLDKVTVVDPKYQRFAEEEAADKTTQPPATVEPKLLLRTVTEAPSPSPSPTPQEPATTLPSATPKASVKTTVEPPAPLLAQQIAPTASDKPMEVLIQRQAPTEQKNEPSAPVAAAREPLAPELPATTFKTHVAEEPLAPQLPLITTKVPSPEDRQEIIFGYEQTMEYLKSYDAGEHANKNLFLYFTCSDDKGHPDDWSNVCSEANKHVLTTFAASPSTNHLVIIRAGSKAFWDVKNKFSEDRDIRVKTVPCLMKWEGRNHATSGMMIRSTLLTDTFLRYLFKNEDIVDPLLGTDATHNGKTITTLHSRGEYLKFIDDYKLEDDAGTPLYLLFVSGRIADNNRPWCPYCRFSELPLEYSFYAFAPPGARLIRVEVAPTYKIWRSPKNPWRQGDHEPKFPAVPAFFRTHRSTENPHEVLFERIIERFDLISSLRSIFA